jgi:hypothetical protein
MRKRQRVQRHAMEGGHSVVSSSKTWIEQELSRCEFKDLRHGKRLEKLLGQFSDEIGGSIPWACQDWANTKAAYRFLANGRVNEAAILSGHFQATQERCSAAQGKDPILVLHDTTEFSYQRERTAPIGLLKSAYMWHDGKGRPRLHTLCGLLMHSSLAVTTEGLPLGLAAVKFWTRSKFKGCNALKKKINPTRVPIDQKESIRWLENLKQSTVLLADGQRCVHIGDRESDIYEFFCAAQAAETHFLVRTCVDRLAGDGRHTIADEMKEVRIQGLHRVQVRNKRGDVSEAVLEIRYRRIRVLPSRGKQKQHPPLGLTVIHVQERGKPQGREKIHWKLMTDLPVASRRDALEKIQWYSLRWKLETFHKILKSGCQAEAAKLRTAERLVNLIAVLCILGWRIFWMTMINRSVQAATPKLAFTGLELRLLDQLVKDEKDARSRPKPLSAYLTKLARLGGYLARANDAPPGNMVMWRGISRLTDIELGFMIGAQLVGN